MLFISKMDLFHIKERVGKGSADPFIKALRKGKRRASIRKWHKGERHFRFNRPFIGPIQNTNGVIKLPLYSQFTATYDFFKHKLLANSIRKFSGPGFAMVKRPKTDKA